MAVKKATSLTLHDVKMDKECNTLGVSMAAML